MLLCTMDKFLLIASFLITPALGAMCSGSRLTDSDRQLILNAHNTRRSNLAKGLEPTRGGGRAPASSQMYKMSYDCALEAQAQAYAQQCRIGVHSGGRYGENLYWSSAGGPASTHLQTAASMWWGELTQYGISDPRNILTMGVFNTGVGHFTQMAWWRTTKVGCGVANCNYNGYSGSTQVVCQYLEQGNYINQVIYPLGSPCTSNSQCTAIAGSICSVSEGLCVDPVAQAGGTGTGGVVPPPSGSCYDTADNCVNNQRLCQDRSYRQLMHQQCQKTCGYCTGGSPNVPSGSCSDTANNCAQNFNLCNDYTYRSLMSQQCRKTCGQC